MLITTFILVIGSLGHDNPMAPALVVVDDWEGLSQSADQNDHQADWDSETPPDPTIAMTDGFVVTIVNRTIKVFDEEGNEVLDAQNNPMEDDLVDFLDLQGDPNRYDPRVVFDAEADRFVMCCLAGDNGLKLKIAWSEVSTHEAFPDLADWEISTAIATGWSTLDEWDEDCGTLDMSPTIIDQPSLGYDETAWYASSFKIEGPGPPADGVSVNVFHTFEKADAVADPIYTFSNNWSPEWCLSTDDVQGAETTRAVEHFDQPTADDSGDPSPFFVGVIRKSLPLSCNGANDPPTICCD